MPPYTKIIEEPNLKGLRIAVLDEYFCDSLHSEIAGLFYEFVDFLRSMKTVIIDDIKLQDTEEYYESWRNIRLAEATNVHLNWINRRAGDYSPEVRKMLLQGKRISAADYIKSLRTVKEIKSVFLAMFLNRKIDAIVVPSTIVPAPRVVDNIIRVGKNVVLETRQALLRNTIVFNSTGLPAISIPIGFTNSNIPVGVQIVGPPFKEEIILSIAYCYEQISSIMDTFVPQLH